MKNVLILFMILIQSGAFAQRHSKDKNQSTSERLIGTWKFDYALYTVDFFGQMKQQKSNVFHTDTIFFFRDKTFRFRVHNVDMTTIRHETGNWEITDGGKILILKDRQDEPPFEEPATDVALPIKIIKSNRIRIVYKILLDGVTSDKNNTPVYFNRIN